MKLTKNILLLLCAVALGFGTAAKKDHWRQLFNGKNLAGWDTYIGPDLDDSGKPITGTPLGLNNDPRRVFTVVKDGDENVIRISGENWGALISRGEYENYHLQLQFKWGNATWGQKKGKKKDSGLLYHSVGKYGADYGAWMRAQEFQVEEGNTGDWGLWSVLSRTTRKPLTCESVRGCATATTRAPARVAAFQPVVGVITVPHGSP